MPITDLSKLNLNEIQGNILQGHGRDHLALIFLQFGGDAVKTRQWLLKLTTPVPADPNAIVVTNQTVQFAQKEAWKAVGLQSLFVNLFLTESAYTKLGKAPPTDQRFIDGLPASQGTLTDPPIADWEAPFQQPIDAMLLLANDHQQHLARSVAAAKAEIAAAGGTVHLVQNGDALRNAQAESIEHFGYVDGRSQPIFLQADLESEAKNNWGIKVWEPGEDAFDVALVPDAIAADPKAFGSYFVFRKLEQNVRLFKQTELALANTLGLSGEASELAGAMVV